MKVIERREDRVTAAEEIIADFNHVRSWGRVWNLKFEPAKCPPYMALLPIEEVDTLNILGFGFDCKLS